MGREDHADNTKRHTTRVCSAATSTNIACRLAGPRTRVRENEVVDIHLYGI